MQCALSREYEREAACREHIEPFARWLQLRCAELPASLGGDVQELRALCSPPSRRVCSFRSMMAYGSHFRVEGDEAAGEHVTYDCGVAELQDSRGSDDSPNEGGFVELVRVGTLKDIIVLDYVNVNVVLMVVSWVAKDSEHHPRMRRDSHGFWLANMAARPRCNTEPYILPVLASQVPKKYVDTRFESIGGGGGSRTCRSSESCNEFVQVFFAADKTDPGWSVVLQKEARGRRISSMGVEHFLGQEESSADRDVFTNMEGDRGEAGDENDVDDGTPP